jgi:hypothetical protein
MEFYVYACGFRMCGVSFLLRNVYISVLYVRTRRRCVKVKLMHDSVSTALREGAEKPNTGASVPVIVHGDHPFSYRTRNSDATSRFCVFASFMRSFIFGFFGVLWLYCLFFGVFCMLYGFYVRKSSVWSSRGESGK